MLIVSKIVAGLTTAAAAVGIALVGDSPDPQIQYINTVKHADAEFRAAEQRCQVQMAEQFQLCIAVALANKWRRVADAEVKLHDSPDTRHAQRVVQAGGSLLVTLQKCNARAAWEQPSCRELAKDTFRREVSRARLQLTRERECTLRDCNRPVAPLIQVNDTVTMPAHSLRAAGACNRAVTSSTAPNAGSAWAMERGRQQEDSATRASAPDAPAALATAAARKPARQDPAPPWLPARTT